MDPELIARAHAAIAAGADPAAVGARYQSMTGQALPPAEAAPAAPAPEPAKKGGMGAAVMDYLQMLSQGVTMRGGDELAGAVAAIPGGLTPAEAVAASRRATARARDRRGAGASVAEGVGALATGLLAPASVGVRGSLMAPTLAAGASGAVEGGMMGAMGSEGSLRERAPKAVVPALAGFGGGFLLGGGAGLLAHRAGGRGARVGAALVEETGLPADFGALRQGARDARRAVSRNLFGPIDDVGPMVPGREVADALNSAGLPVRPRTLTQLQRTERSLRRSNPAAADELKDAMAREIGGLSDANTAYAPAAREFDALKLGRKSYRTADDIRAAMEGMSPEASRNFAAARLHDIVAKLEARDADAVGMLKQFLDAGPETQAQLRTLFRGDDEAFGRFMSTLATERNAAKIAALLDFAAPIAKWGAIGTVGYGLLR